MLLLTRSTIDKVAEGLRAARRIAPIPILRADDTSRAGRDLIAGVRDPRRREVLELRLTRGLSAAEVQQALTLTERGYYRLITLAMRDIEQELDARQTSTL
jgi:DNA-directed RNA polymerase specialized sigma24 family protein